MIDQDTLIAEVGEKALIRDLIRPLLNPDADADSIGDDCALVELPPGTVACISTDRVPSDLVSFRLGILDYDGLGHYLAVLNLSDIAAMGGEPLGLLLNLGLPPNFRVADLAAMLCGAQRACEATGCKVIGGDLSSSTEMSISATSIGAVPRKSALRRIGARVHDSVYCTDVIGLAPTAFAYFLRARPAGFSLNEAEEETLKDCFRAPKPRFEVARSLASSCCRVTAMDNTDGVAQSLLEIGEKMKLAIKLVAEKIPIHPLTTKVAEALGESAVALALGPGADFQLVGTLSNNVIATTVHSDVRIIGEVISGEGVWLETSGVSAPFPVRGWNYYSAAEADHSPIGSLDSSQ